MTDASLQARPPAARPASPPAASLLAALEGLRDLLGAVRLPLESAGAGDARRALSRLVEQLDDYVLPRLHRLDAPLLVVVGGSTGAGKSTLVNSLVGSQVSAAGVLRPTTRAPVLVHAPADVGWFAERRLLPGLARTTGEGTDAGGLVLRGSERMPPGLALLDAPDIDSVVTANRELAGQLLAAADLWLFLTTAARYADAVPWALLREASQRSAAVAIVLDRVPPAAVEEIRSHLTSMLHREGLGDSPMFVVPETVLEDGRLPETIVFPLREWLRRLATDAEARGAVARMTLTGVVSSYAQRLPEVVDAIDEQDRVAASLRASASAAYDDAQEAIDSAVRDGSLLRGEVLARWQDVVGAGDVLRSLQGSVARWRDRASAALAGRTVPSQELSVALESGVEALVHARADDAAEAVVLSWRAEPAGVALLHAAGQQLDRSSPDLPERVGRMLREWQGYVLDLVTREGAGRRRMAKFLAYGVNGAALSVMIVVFASTGGLTGGEVLVAGGASALSQKVLEALLGDQAVRTLAEQARDDLDARVALVLAQERDRFSALLDGVGTGVAAEDLRRAGADVLRALENVR